MRTGRPTIERGDVITADFLDRVVDGIVQRILISGGTVRKVGTSLAIAIDRQGGGGGACKFAVITAINDDDLTCKEYDPVADAAVDTSETFRVAKPPAAQMTRYDGETVAYQNGQSVSYTYTDERERTADDGSSSETQVMTPDYYVGELIVAAPMTTSVTWTDGDSVVHRIVWQDINAAGRYWAKEA